MQLIVSFAFKLIRRVYLNTRVYLEKFYCTFLFFANNIKFKNFQTNGIPYISIAFGGTCKIGYNFKMINSLNGNPIGRPQRCVFFVDKGASLAIGNNVGISCTAIVSHLSIVIEDNVKVGAGVCIYDTDFHAVNPTLRKNDKMDMIFKVKLPVLIKQNVFIGAHSTILKGVTIGANSIIGACSVVTKNVPENEIWGGNPAKFLKKIH